MLFAHITWWRNQESLLVEIIRLKTFAWGSDSYQLLNSSPNFRKVSRKSGVFVSFFNSLMTFFLGFVINKPFRNKWAQNVSLSLWTLNPYKLARCKYILLLVTGDRNCCSWESLSSDSLFLLERYSRISKN